MNIRDYIHCKDEDRRKEFEQNHFDELFREILEELPASDEHDIFTNGDMIICKSESVAVWLTHILTTITGYNQLLYSPAYAGEDNGKGWWYIDNCGDDANYYLYKED